MIVHDGKWFGQMKFLDERDEIISHYKWSEFSNGQEISHEIPAEHEIIGLYMSYERR